MKVALEKKSMELFSSSNLTAKILKLNESDALDFLKIRKAYRNLMEVCTSKQERILLNLVFLYQRAKKDKSEIHEVEEMIVRGELFRLQLHMAIHQLSYNMKIGEYPLIYIAVRSGHLEIVEHLIRNGANIHFEEHKSTPLHCAAYYGHKSIINLLLSYGISTKVKNYLGHIPLQEAATEQIVKILKEIEKNKIYMLYQNLKKQRIAHSFVNIYDKNDKIVVKKIILQNSFKKEASEYKVNAFHGTSYDPLISIAKIGLKKAGQKIQCGDLAIVEGHVHLGRKMELMEAHRKLQSDDTLGLLMKKKTITKVQKEQIEVVENWASAIFASPSIFYASHDIYSKQFKQNEKQIWLPVVQLKLREGSYKYYIHTLDKYKYKENQPANLEYRVLNSKDLIVVAILFLRKDFSTIYPNYIKATELILNSPEEANMRRNKNRP